MRHGPPAHARSRWRCEQACVMGRGVDLLQLHGDGIGLEIPTQMGDGVPRGIPEDDDRRLGTGSIIVP